MTLTLILRSPPPTNGLIPLSKWPRIVQSSFRLPRDSSSLFWTICFIDSHGERPRPSKKTWLGHAIFHTHRWLTYCQIQRRGLNHMIRIEVVAPLLLRESTKHVVCFRFIKSTETEFFKYHLLTKILRCLWWTVSVIIGKSFIKVNIRGRKARCKTCLHHEKWVGLGPNECLGKLQWIQ